MKVLVVDDDNEVHTLISEHIKKSASDFELMQLFGGDEFHAWLDKGMHAGEPHLFFIDLQMEEETTGLSCLRSLRQNDYFGLSKAIVTSYAANRSIVTASYAAGANLFLPKIRAFSKQAAILMQTIELFANGSFRCAHPPRNQ